MSTFPVLPSPELDEVVERRLPCVQAPDNTLRAQVAALELAFAGLPSGVLTGRDRYDRGTTRRFEWTREEGHWKVTVEPAISAVEATTIAAVRRGILGENGAVEVERLGAVAWAQGSEAPLDPDARVAFWHITTVDGLRTFVGVVRALYTRGDSQGLGAFFLAEDRAKDLLRRSPDEVRYRVAQLYQRAVDAEDRIQAADRHEIEERVRANELQAAIEPLERLLTAALQRAEAELARSKTRDSTLHYFVRDATEVCVALARVLMAAKSRLEGYAS